MSRMLTKRTGNFPFSWKRKSNQQAGVFVEEAGSNDKPAFWPCVGEHPVYDDELYSQLAGDVLRNQHYFEALWKKVRGKVVADIGTGNRALWACEAIRAGAKRVYAIEESAAAAASARVVVAGRGLSERIRIVEGASTQIELPERVDVCVSEILGEIGGAEGAAAVLSDAKNRFLKETGTMIPEMCDTLISPVELSKDLLDNPRFATDSLRYLEEIFNNMGRAFDPRVSIVNHREACKLLSSPRVFESLNFSNGSQQSRRDVSFLIGSDGVMSGFLLWLCFQCSHGQASLDTRLEGTTWFPVFFPVFYPGVEVSCGDLVEMSCDRQLSEDGIHPDYFITGNIIKRRSGFQPFNWKSSHHGSEFRGNMFYEKLFGEL